VIGLVDEWMVGQALELVRHGHHAEVNLSGKSIADDNLMAEIERELRAAGDAARNIVFEITETAAIEHIDAARAFLERLVPLDCRFSLDDFGTGFGSLTYLRHLPVDQLKIDISFVSEAARDSGAQAIVRSVVAMAREFGRHTVAKGIEDKQTLLLMSEYGVDFAQGFLIGRPRPVAEAAGPAAPA
jgi:EAL domain-containing protein (putative c-di-GMP-specific phosphodiesterase class I)